MECPFCDERNLGLRKFYENGLFAAIYNLRPLVKGHCLVFTKRHVKSLFELDADEKSGLASFVSRTVFMATKYADAYQFDIIMQEGASAGQSLEHSHLHIIPRRADDHVSLGKKEWLSEFNKNESSRPGVGTAETMAIVAELKGIAERYRLRLSTL